MLNKFSVVLLSVTSLSDETWTSGNIKVPDGVASLRAFALVMSDTLSLKFTRVPQTVTKTFTAASIHQWYFYKSNCFLLQRGRCASLFVLKKFEETWGVISFS